MFRCLNVLISSCGRRKKTTTQLGSLEGVNFCQSVTRLMVCFCFMYLDVFECYYFPTVSLICLHRFCVVTAVVSVPSNNVITPQQQLVEITLAYFVGNVGITF
jgi:hypothetical protein